MRILTLFLSLIYTSLIVPTIVIIPDITASYVYGVEYTANEVETPENLSYTAKTPVYKTQEEEIRAYIREHAKLMGVNPDLAESLAFWESNFNPEAKNPKTSASGIYQFTSETFSHFCVSDTYNPSVFDWRANVSCALRIIYWEGLGRWSCDPTIKGLLIANGYL